MDANLELLVDIPVQEKSLGGGFPDNPMTVIANDVLLLTRAPELPWTGSDPRSASPTPRCRTGAESRGWKGERLGLRRVSPPFLATSSIEGPSRSDSKAVPLTSVLHS